MAVADITIPAEVVPTPTANDKYLSIVIELDELTEMVDGAPTTRKRKRVSYIHRHPKRLASDSIEVKDLPVDQGNNLKAKTNNYIDDMIAFFNPRVGF